MRDRVEGREIVTKFDEPNYPGDIIARCDLARGDEDGMIVIQWYNESSLRIGAFLPGYEEGSPGDTPKFVPERSVWCAEERPASQQFVGYVIAAFREGWQPVTKG